jgi:hypothetical protein
MERRKIAKSKLTYCDSERHLDSIFDLHIGAYEEFCALGKPTDVFRRIYISSPCTRPPLLSSGQTSWPQI